jgi:hypothetical protein
MAVFTGNGSAASPSLTFSSDTNTGIFRPGADQLGLVTNGATRLFINATGQVGLGITTLSEQLTLAASGVTQNVALMLLGTNTNSGQSNGVKLKAIGSADDSGRGNLAFEIRRTNLNYEEAMRLTSDGRLGIGTTSPAQALHVVGTGIFGDGTNGRLQLLSAATNQNYVDSINNAGTGFQDLQIRGVNLRFLTDASSTPSERVRIDSSGRLLVGTSSTSQTCTLLVQGSSTGSTDYGIIKLARGINNPGINFSLGTLEFGDNGHLISAQVSANRDGGTWTSGSSQPSRLVFSTTADGAASPTERMRIKENGNVAVGGTNANDGGIEMFPNYGGTKSTAIEIGHASGTADGDRYFGFKLGSTVIGSITQSSASAVAYNTSSDYRLKENIVSLTGAIDRLQQIPVHRFNFIADPDKTFDGFIAHEAQAVVPECVTGTKDEVDADGNPIYQGIDQSKLVPLLTAALQEALAEIASLKARVTALEP